MGLMWGGHGAYVGRPWGLVFYYDVLHVSFIFRLNSWGWRSQTSRELWKDLTCLNSSSEYWMDYI